MFPDINKYRFLKILGFEILIFDTTIFLLRSFTKETIRFLQTRNFSEAEGKRLSQWSRYILVSTKLEGSWSCSKLLQAEGGQKRGQEKLKVKNPTIFLWMNASSTSRNQACKYLSHYSSFSDTYLSLFHLLYSSTSTMQRLEISRMQGLEISRMQSLEISRLCILEISRRSIVEVER